MRILLVEDDRMICPAMTRALKGAAYAIDWVMDGETAIEAAEVEPYDLALLDLGLPAADGLEILWRFRKVGRQLPVIIVTARDRIDDRIDRLDLGAADYLVKPFWIRKLLARMRAILLLQGSGTIVHPEQWHDQSESRDLRSRSWRRKLPPDCTRILPAAGIADAYRCDPVPQ